MQSPFLIARFVVFALLANLNILILAFATWSASTVAHSGISVSCTTVFFILESCVFLISVILGMAELVIPQANRTATVFFECVWTAILSIFQTGTAISATVNVSGTCRFTDNWELCASASLLIPVSWLSSIILFAYFLALCITAIGHVSLFPEIWTQSIHSVDWFNLRDSSFINEKVDSHNHIWSRQSKDIEATGHHADDSTMRAPWAKNTIRRGIDAPFKSNGPSVTSSSSTAMTPYTVAPFRTQSRSVVGSRFVERLRESARLSRRESVSQMQMQSASESQVNAFPPRVEDYNLPIPLPRLSEWIRADDINTIDVHDNTTRLN